jgi:hypothetical protein
MNSYGSRAAARTSAKIVVEFYLNLVPALTVIRRLIGLARTLYRWPTRPTTPGVLDIICRNSGPLFLTQLTAPQTSLGVRLGHFTEWSPLVQVGRHQRLM